MHAYAHIHSWIMHDSYACITFTNHAWFICMHYIHESCTIHMHALHSWIMHDSYACITLMNHARFMCMHSWIVHVSTRCIKNHTELHHMDASHRCILHWCITRTSHTRSSHIWRIPWARHPGITRCITHIQRGMLREGRAASSLVFAIRVSRGDTDRTNVVGRRQVIVRTLRDLLLRHDPVDLCKQFQTLTTFTSVHWTRKSFLQFYYNIATEMQVERIIASNSRVTKTNQLKCVGHDVEILRQLSELIQFSSEQFCCLIFF